MESDQAIVVVDQEKNAKNIVTFEDRRNGVGDSRAPSSFIEREPPDVFVDLRKHDVCRRRGDAGCVAGDCEYDADECSRTDAWKSAS